MSYLDDQRMNFSGTFFTDPSTINNYPQNYEADSWTPKNMQLWWNPMGRADFILKDCSVKSIDDGLSYADQSSDPDSIIGQSITVVASPFPGKIVDLDPQQQGTSALYGVQILIGELDGPYVMGDFESTSFRQMWSRAGSSCRLGFSCYGGIYQSTLTNLVWNESGSKYLEELKNTSPDTLSIKFTLDLFNGSPVLYQINDQTESILIEAGVSSDVIDTLKEYNQYGYVEGNNFIPTEVYFTYLLEQNLTTEQYENYKDEILSSAIQPYTAGSLFDPSTPVKFTQGRIIGAVGPSSSSEPTRTSWSRMLNKIGDKGGFTPFLVENNILKIDLSNTLLSKLTSDPSQALGEIDLDALGDSLDFGYYENKDPSNFTSIVTLDSSKLNDDLLMNKGGILEIDLTPDQYLKLESLPCMIKDGNGDNIVVEQEDGYYLSADQVVYSMNPECDDPNRGDTQELKICVSQYGNKKQGVEVYTKVVDPLAAKAVFGPSPAPSIPHDALTLSIDTQGEKTDTISAISDANGIATFTLNASNPGNPRVYIDGQLYYIGYALEESAISVSDAVFGQNMNGAYVLVTTDTPMVQNPTWDADIGPILSQYGYLYPIMKQFDLSNYDVVTKYNQAILAAMKLPIDDSNHMPVTRDFSVSRLALLEQWINTGMAKS